MACLVSTFKLSCTKEDIENIINSQFEYLECAICCSAIDENHKGVINITSTGMADLEHLFCIDCHLKFLKKDPYKRDIMYRHTYPFESDEDAREFIKRSKAYIIEEKNDNKVNEFTNTIKDTLIAKYVDEELNFAMFK
uniref:ORF110 protein n=1 Tax=Plutella xylostella granulovirus TaxID=98383 RepID=A0A7U3UIS8_9BBAC|nr:ORF110 protein [Plutella xylostella granulovirus]QKV50153.1 ORF110 protein [Plutella xylostella granulovirus]